MSTATVRRLKEEIKELNAYCEVLKAALTAYGVETIAAPSGWAASLAPSERSVVGALFTAYPKALRRYDLLDLLPLDDHVVEDERSPRIIQVKVCNIRKKLGYDVIENVWGLGYKLGDAFYARIIADQEGVQQLAA